ncbi:MAG TPA: xanthine dehydrogenase family protein molybdopterin-binding subunit [Candidatus Dormibacteraeota bacterium]
MAREVLGLMRGKWIGAPIKRVEDPRFLSGEAIFAGDISLPRMLHAAFVRSPHGHAKILSIDSSRAAKMPGVVLVVTAKDADFKPLVDLLPPLDGLQKTPQPLLVKDHVRFVGEAIAVVVAEDRYLAEDAAGELESAIQYEPLPALVDAVKAMDEKTNLLHPELGSNVFYRKKVKVGDVEAAFKSADKVIKRTYHTNRVSAAPMEGRACVAKYDKSFGQLTLWISTQSPHVDRNLLAESLEIPENKVRVIAPDVGGGFGQKQPTHPEELVVAAMARRLGRPVKWVEDRREHLLASAHAKEQTINLEGAFKKDGSLLALRAQCIGDSGGYSFNPTSGLIEPSFSATGIPGVYDLKNYEYEIVGVLTNKTPTGPYRGVGWTAGNTAREALLDLAARELGLDPVQIRLQNMIQSDQFPYRNCIDMLYDSGSYVETLKKACEMAGYDDFRKQQVEARKAGKYLGLGLCVFVEPSAFGSDVAAQMGWPLPSHDNASVSMDPSGKVIVSTGHLGHGQGHETSFAQLAADTLGIDVKDVIVQRGDTESAPWGMGTYASRSAVIAGGSISYAARDVRDRLLAIAGNMLEAPAQDLEIEDGKIFVKGSPNQSIDVTEVAHAAYYNPRIRVKGVEPRLQSTRFYDPPACYSNGTVIALVEVDIETGITKLRRIVFVEDCGTMINPFIIEGMMAGAIAQGAGSALMEHLVYDASGQLLTTTYMDYLIPTAADLPSPETAHLETPSPFTVGGIKGMGEGGVISTPSAVTNAIMDALAPFNPELRDLPLGPDKVVKIVQAAIAKA